MTTFSKDLRDTQPGGLSDIYVSKWTEDGNVNIRFGAYAHETSVSREPHMADRLGWALPQANSRQDMPNGGEPDRD